MIFRSKSSVVFSLLLTLNVAAARAADVSSVATLAKPSTNGMPWRASAIIRLRSDIDKLLQIPAVRSAHVGFIATDTKNGTPLYSRNADQEFMPASNFKLLTGSAALSKLGTDFSFLTTVRSDGSMSSGVLNGNLYLRGGGDPLLRASDLENAAAQLAASGISRITGAVYTDASYFDYQRYGFGWSWDDFPYYYAAVVSALSLEENVIHVHIRPGDAVGSPVQLVIAPATQAFKVDNRMTTGPKDSKDSSDIERRSPDTITLTGSYPLGAKESEDLVPAVPDPQRYAGDVFLSALQGHGIAVTGPAISGPTPVGARVLWTHSSEKLPLLLADFWYPSDNLMGELLLKALGVAKSGAPGSDPPGIVMENDYLRSVNVDPKTVSITDGSGLSQYDRITPRDLWKILQSDWDGPNRDIVLDALPVSGVRGTLEGAYKGTPAEKMVFAKTGSISHVRTISGFIRTRRHGAVTFSFMLDDWLEDGPALAKLRADIFSRFVTD